MSSVPIIDIAAPNNADGMWTRDVSAIAAVEPALATAIWRIQVRRSAATAVVYLDIPNTHGSLTYVSGVLIVRVPITVMRTIPAGEYVWDGIYTTTDGRTVKWFEGTFTVEQGVTR